MIENFMANLAGLLPFGYAFGAGMVTTVSPCGIAMLPAYISLHLGTNSEVSRTESSLRRGTRALMMGGVVTLGFMVFFGIMGAIISLGGQLLVRFIPWIAVIVGAALFILGIFLLFGGYFYTNLPVRLASRLGRNGNPGIRGFFIFGIAYGIAALSCTLPVFLTVVGSALATKGLTSGILQFISFALGMGFVIVIITIGSALFKETINLWLHRLVPIVARLSGLLLVFAGGYILYYWFGIGDIIDRTF